MLAPFLAALSLCAVAAAAPLPPAPPAPPDAPAAAPAPVAPEPPQIRPEVAAWGLAHPVIVLDGPAGPSEWIEWVAPAGMPQSREARSETLLAVPRSTSLDVRNVAGTIAVQAWKRNEVRIVAEHGRLARLVPRLVNGTLTVTLVDRRGAPAFGDVTLQVPEWMPLRLSSVESPIDVEGVRAAIEAGSVRGDVVVRKCRGVLQLRSVEGGVHVVDARGRLQVASINSLVRLVRVNGLIDAESVNGDIQLSQVESPDVEASSVNGSVDFTGPFQPRGRYRLISHRGNLRVGVPVDAAVDVSVANFNGEFESGFPLRAVPRTKGRRFTFTLGGGGSSLELQSFDGLIQLLRAGEPPEPPHAPQAPAPPAAKEDSR